MLCALQDFLDLLPFPWWMHPLGPLNLASHLEADDNPPDLGPKSYIAYGRCARADSAVAVIPGSPNVLDPLVRQDSTRPLRL